MKLSVRNNEEATEISTMMEKCDKKLGSIYPFVFLIIGFITVVVLP